MSQTNLAALISAYHEADEGGAELRATLPLAGRTLVERQARVAAAAGADPVVLLVERLPPALLAAIDRLRAEGLNIVTARSVREAADAVGGDERLLLIADGFVAEGTHMSRLLAAGGSALLTIPDFGADDRFERIDAESRWAGLALIDGGLLKTTAAMMVQDWDLQSTLLRRAVQSGARHFSVGAGEPLILAERGSDLVEVQARIVAGAGESRQDWVSRYLLAPVEEAATRLLMPTAASPDWLRLGAIALTAASAFAFVRGWMIPGAFLLVAATPLPGIAERLGRLRMHAGAPGGWAAALLPALAGAASLGLGYGASRDLGWGCVVLAVAIIAFALALRQEAKSDVPGKMLLAEWKGMAWLMLPFAVTGLWTTGLGLLALYSGGSFFWAQHHAHSRFPAAPHD